jgi:hypothetical protein
MSDASIQTSPLFILGSGRSGTTLLQRLLNTYDDVTVWGEHGGFLRHTAAAFYRLAEDAGNEGYLSSSSEHNGAIAAQDIQALKDPAKWQAWINCFRRQDLPALFRAHVEGFLAMLYPTAHFAFVARHPLDTIASQLRAFHGGSRLVKALPTRTLLSRCHAWRVQTEYMYAWHTSRRIRSFWLPYDDVVGAGESLMQFLAALGKDLGPSQRAVLEMDEGRGTAFGRHQLPTERWKTLGYVNLLMADCILRSAYERFAYRGPTGLAWISRPVSRAITALGRSGRVPQASIGYRSDADAPRVTTADVAMPSSNGAARP